MASHNCKQDIETSNENKNRRVEAGISIEAREFCGNDKK
jgi:hypothetical protein